MNMEKSSISNKIAGGACVCVAAFMLGIMIGRPGQASVSGTNSCSISIEATNVDGSITTKMKTDGSQDSCDALLTEINAYTVGNQDAQDDDSAASDADEASAPVGASQ